MIEKVLVALGVLVCLPFASHAQTGTASTSATLYWPKGLSYYVGPSGYADVPGHSRQKYVVTAASGTSLVVGVDSRLFIHVYSTVSIDPYIPITIPTDGVWTREDSLWLMGSLTLGTYTSKATSKLTAFGSSVSSEDPGAFSVIFPDIPPDSPPGGGGGS